MISANLLSKTLAVGLLALGASAASAQDEVPRQVLFTNVNIFNGVDGELMENGSVLVEGNLIKTVSAEAIDAPDAYTVDGEGAHPDARPDRHAFSPLHPERNARVSRQL